MVGHKAVDWDNTLVLDSRATKEFDQRCNNLGRLENPLAIPRATGESHGTFTGVAGDVKPVRSAWSVPRHDLGYPRSRGGTSPRPHD